MRCRLMVGQRNLDPFIGVRIPAPQQLFVNVTKKVNFLLLRSVSVVTENTEKRILKSF